MEEHESLKPDKLYYIKKMLSDIQHTNKSRDAIDPEEDIRVDNGTNSSWHGWQMIHNIAQRDKLELYISQYLWGWGPDIILMQMHYPDEDSVSTKDIASMVNCDEIVIRSILSGDTKIGSDMFMGIAENLLDRIQDKIDADHPESTRHL